MCWCAHRSYHEAIHSAAQDRGAPASREPDDATSRVTSRRHQPADAGGGYQSDGGAINRRSAATVGYQPSDGHSSDYDARGYQRPPR